MSEWRSEVTTPQGWAKLDDDTWVDPAAVDLLRVDPVRSAQTEVVLQSGQIVTVRCSLDEVLDVLRSWTSAWSADRGGAP